MGTTRNAPDSPAAPTGGKLAAFTRLAGEETTARIAQNELLFEWLGDDDERAALYGELAAAGFPSLRFKSVMGPTADPAWPHTDVYLISRPDDVATALRKGSVAPYGELESGGSFMLALDDAARHDAQRNAAARAMRLSGVPALMREAVRRASVLPFKQDAFELPQGLAEEAALRFAELYFGISHLAHGELKVYFRAVYTKLTFVIIGRHFVADSGLGPGDSKAAKELTAAVRQWIADARTPDAREVDERVRRGLPRQGVIERLAAEGAFAGDEKALVDVVIGLIGGTIGNITAAVSIAIAEFFSRPRRAGDPWLIDAARCAALHGDNDTLERMIEAALARNPPAAFLARSCCTRDGSRRLPLTYETSDGRRADIPKDATLLLALGAGSGAAHLFGGEHPAFMHQCLGEWLARPLVHAIVCQLLRLPGLRPALDLTDGQPVRLKKRWGVACESYRLEYQRQRRLNQQPLILKIPIKEPVAENAARLEALTRGGAWIVDDALDGARHVHFAWFMLLEGGTHLGMVTAYDGDFDAYVEHFATAVDLFDEQLQYLEGAPEAPVRKNPKAFVEWVRAHNHKPLGGYFYSAYPRVSASQVHNAFPPHEEGQP